MASLLIAVVTALLTVLLTALPPRPAEEGNNFLLSLLNFSFTIMFEIFEKYLRTWVDISGEELEMIRNGATEKTLRKWQSILHDGETWKVNCFIAKGCFRLYRFDKDGNDHTMRFGVENWWITDQQSYNHGTPSEYNIEALID